MDALPIEEENEVAYRSKNIGVMHACGHDTHIAMLLGATKILNSMKDQLKGNIKLVFQPAEEGAPAGEEGGAGLMIQEGLMNNPAVDVAFGLHVNSLTPVGHINYKPAGIIASVLLLLFMVYTIYVLFTNDDSKQIEYITKLMTPIVNPVISYYHQI